MSYRSDVALAMYKKDFNRMIEAGENLVFENGDTLSKLFEHAAVRRHIANGDEIVSVMIPDTKWNDSVGSAKYVMEFLETDGMPCVFARVGEACGDVEYRSYDPIGNLGEIVGLYACVELYDPFLDDTAFTFDQYSHKAKACS